jgi:hypothetical protein
MEDIEVFVDRLCGQITDVDGEEERIKAALNMIRMDMQ